jgi:hypothetical protein
VEIETEMTDSKGNNYKEVEIPGGHVRLTYVQDGWANSPSIRVQIRDDSGHLRQGPEIPVAAVGGMVGSIVELIAAE